MSKKKTAAEALAELRKRRDDREKMPRVKSLPHLRIAVELPEAPIIPRQATDKTAFLETVRRAWEKFPSLKFGQVIAGACGDRIYHLEDENMEKAIAAFDPSRPGRCKESSPSGKFVCSLEENHPSNEHINYEIGFAWKR